MGQRVSINGIIFNIACRHDGRYMGKRDKLCLACSSLKFATASA